MYSINIPTGKKMEDPFGDKSRGVFHFDSLLTRLLKIHGRIAEERSAENIDESNSQKEASAKEISSSKSPQVTVLSASDGTLHASNPDGHISNARRSDHS